MQRTDKNPAMGYKSSTKTRPTMWSIKPCRLLVSHWIIKISRQLVWIRTTKPGRLQVSKNQRKMSRLLLSVICKCTRETSSNSELAQASQKTETTQRLRLSMARDRTSLMISRSLQRISSRSSKAKMATRSRQRSSLRWPSFKQHNSIISISISSKFPLANKRLKTWKSQLLLKVTPHERARWIREHQWKVIAAKEAKPIVHPLIINWIIQISRPLVSITATKSDRPLISNKLMHKKKTS